MSRKTIFNILLGPVLFLISMYAIPEDLLPFAVRGALGLFLWMSAWWITIPVGVAVTSLVPILVTSVWGIVTPATILPQYFSDLVVLLLGANIITLTWGVTGLNRRIALRALSLVGPSMKSQITAWFAVSTLISIFLPNIVVAATLTPIALAMLSAVKKDDPSVHLSAANILLAIAWGSGMGGFGSPIGGGMNLVVIGYIEQLTGQEYMYTTWVSFMFPILILILIGGTIHMRYMKSEADSLPGAREYFISEYQKLGKMTRVEALSMWLFVIPVVMAFTRQLWVNLIPSLGSSYVFLVFAIIAFVLPGNDNGRLITWKFAQPKISWGLFYTLAGGLALGKVIVESGASDMIASLVTESGVTNATVLTILFIVLASVLANISSNNSAVAITSPLVVSVMSALGQNPIPYLYLAAVGGNLAYLLPSATRAIPVDAGVSPAYMLKKGLLANFIALAIAIVAAIFYLEVLKVG